MNKIASTCLTFLFCYSSANLQADASKYEDYELLCTPSGVTGFAYNPKSKRWEQTRFTTKHKYIVVKSDNEYASYYVKDFKTNENRYYCKRPIDEYGYLRCGRMLSANPDDMQINVVSERYVFTGSGYYNVYPKKVRKKMMKEGIRKRREMEKNGIDASFLFSEPLTDETADTPFVEIGDCERF